MHTTLNFQHITWGSQSYLPAHNNTAGGLACGGGSFALLRGPGASGNLKALRKRAKLFTWKEQN